MGFSALGNMVDTVTKNIIALEDGSERLYQRGAWTYRLGPRNQMKLRAALRTLLENADAEARLIIEKHEDPRINAEHLTAGVSLFYFEESES
jgi:hypothetical protein